MALPVYLAMTAAEISTGNVLPENLGYMACHFSAYGTGLSGIPDALPEGVMLLLNDRTPIAGHDPKLIALQLKTICERFRASCLLLDFQRPDVPQIQAVADEILQTLPCPVGISDLYAANMEAPVFLPPVPLDIPLSEYLEPWKGREIWLEVAADALCLTLTKQGCKAVAVPPPKEAPYYHDTLCCSYQIETNPEQARFLLCRTKKALDALLNQAADLGVTRAVGLYQQLHELFGCTGK